MNAFIFHGTGGYPEENWFSWLKQKLEIKDFEVFVPQFPTPEGQSLKAWLSVLAPLRNKINGETILIGHSLGGVFTLKLLEILEEPVKLAILVGTPIGVRSIKNFEQDKSFAGFEFNWKNIKQNSKNFIVYHSDNDPYVSLENGKELAKNLGVKLTFVPNAGHFNKQAGYTTFEDLLYSINIIK
jgi:predicted alpha/beta hydrolase family esterase